MKKYYLLLISGLFFMGSCQEEELANGLDVAEDEILQIQDDEIVNPPNDQSTDSSDNQSEDTSNDQFVDFEEYFRYQIDDVPYSVEDQKKIAGRVYPSLNTGVIAFDFYGVIIENSEDSNFFRELNFKVCFYDGLGTYYTGTTSTVSWAYYWTTDGYWENHYSYGNDPGIVTITRADEYIVEGIFEYEAYNENSENTILVKGEFGVILESGKNY